MNRAVSLGRGIETVIFDLGGVLIEQPVESILRYCADYLKADLDALKQAHQKYMPDFQRGRISETCFWERICAEMKAEEPDALSLWGEAFSHCYIEKTEVLALAANLHRAGYKIGLLSDTEMPSVNYFLSRQYDFFDFLVFSCLEGAIKPAPEIYRRALERSRTEPCRSVFIDDVLANVKGAEDLGIRGVLFETPDRLEKRLFGLDVNIESGSVRVISKCPA